MPVRQAIDNPSGVTAFGSAILRIDPDMVSVQFSVSRREDLPKDAFRLAHEGSKDVQYFLAQSGLDDYGSSHISLAQSFEYVKGERKFFGYQAEVNFHLILRELDRVEEILIGITDAGANIIKSVDYETSRLKEHRAEVRRKAVAAALEKAELYCRAANATLGSVIHIEDVNPDQLRGRESHGIREATLEHETPTQAFNPSSIVVAGAVMIVCEIGNT